jgi:hypothetical protein
MAATGQSEVDPLVAEMVRQPLNRPSGTGDFRSISLRGEGRTLIVRIETVPEMADVVTADVLASAFAGSFCVNPRYQAFFSAGRTLRVERLIAGHPPETASLDHCPGPVGGGFSAASFASALQAFVGREVDGISFRSIRAEGETVVAVADGPVGWRDDSTSAVLADAFLSNFCDQASGHQPFFDGVRKIRIDTLEAGDRLIQGQPIASCPAR